MRFSRSLGVGAGLVSGLCLIATPRAVRAEDDKKAECASTYEKSQELRASGKLTRARDLLVVCAQNVCPAFVQTDCAQWLSEVRRELPTVVISAQDTKGEDTVAVRVTLDGVLLLGELDGKGTPIDPGVHKLHFELDGAPPIDQQIVIRQAEKDRPVAVSWGPPGADLPADNPYAGSSTLSPDPDREQDRPGPLRPYAFVAGGVGAAGIVGFAVLGALGKGEQNDLESKGCRPKCPQSDVDAIKTKYVLADVSLGFGIAGLGTGVALFLLSQPKAAHHPSDARTVKFDVHTSPSSAFATVSGAF